MGPSSYTFAWKEVRPGKKMICPLTVGTQQLHLRTQGSASRQKNKTIRPPDRWDPPVTPSHTRKCVRAKKRFAPLTAGTHQLHLRTQGSASGQKKMIRPPDRWDPPATSSHARKCFLYYAEIKSFLSVIARAHQLYYDPFRENRDCTKDPKLFFYSNSKKKI